VPSFTGADTTVDDSRNGALVFVTRVAGNVIRNKNELAPLRLV
jgi:hypothetical protein